MFEVTYEKKFNGEWIKWDKDIFGNVRGQQCRAPKEVRDCAAFYSVNVVVYNGFKAEPVYRDGHHAAYAGRLAREAQLELEEAERREYLRDATLRREREAVEALGGFLGGLIGELTRPRKK